MLNTADIIPREIIDQIVAEIERLAEDARDRWSLPKHDRPHLQAAWSSRETGYREVLKLFASQGLTPAKHAG